jgi:hypothetical protein
MKGMTHIGFVLANPRFDAAPTPSSSGPAGRHASAAAQALAPARRFRQPVPPCRRSKSLGMDIYVLEL